MHFIPSDNEVDIILKLDSPKRFDYCLKRIVDWGEIWVLDHHGVVIYEDMNANKYCPIWPAKKFAEKAAIDDWANANAICIKVKSMMKDYSSIFTQENIQLAVLPNIENQATCLTIAEIKNYIENESLKY